MKFSTTIVLSLLFITPAGADPVDECIKGDGDSQIAACTQIINSGLHRGQPITMDNLPAIYVHRGTAFGEKGQYKKALADLSKAIELDPKLTMAWGDRGDLYNAFSRYEKAVADFTRATKQDPTFDKGFAGLGYAWFRLGYEEKAITAYSKAIKLFPNFADYYYARAGVYMEEIYADGKIPAKRLKLLRADLNKVLQLNPKHTGAKTDLESLRNINKPAR